MWFHTHYVSYIFTISILKNRPFCNVSYKYGVSSVYTIYTHFMTYPESSCLIKLTSSESRTITNEKFYPIHIKMINSKPAEHTI